MEKKWRIKKKDGKIYGPADAEKVKKWIGERRLLPEELLSVEGEEKWTPAKSVPEFADSFAEKIAEKKEGVPVSKETKCPQCGGSLAEGAVFCINCGTDIKTGQKEKGMVVAVGEDKNSLTFQLIADAWRAMLHKGMWFVIGAGFLLVLVSIAGSFVANSLPILGQIISVLISGSLTVGWAGYCLKVLRKEKVSVGTIFAGFKGCYIWCAFGAMWLIGLLTVLVGITIIWPIYLSLAWSLTWLFIFDNKMGPWEAMKASYDATRGFKWRIVAVGTVCGFIGIFVGPLTLGIGFLVIFALQNMAMASLYYRIQSNALPEKFVKTKPVEYLLPLLTFLIAVGIIAAVGFFIAKSGVLDKLLLIFQEYMESLPQTGEGIPSFPR